MKILLILILALVACSKVEEPEGKKKRFPYHSGKDEFFESCEKELPYYKCEILFSQKDMRNPSVPGVKDFIIGGAAAGAASAVTKSLLK